MGRGCEGCIGHGGLVSVRLGARRLDVRGMRGRRGVFQEGGACDYVTECCKGTGVRDVKLLQVCEMCVLSPIDADAGAYGLSMVEIRET